MNKKKERKKQENYSKLLVRMNSLFKIHLIHLICFNGIHCPLVSNTEAKYILGMMYTAQKMKLSIKDFVQ